ncbi:anti-sigma factor [Paenibacillus eucommiae]|uniref:Sigma factor regulator N-terminal n=1 Tax=Paenibacillus eucommiae TaxID=1355755 RepID=A0ABS4JAK2_9BACL|nr:anti-sigma factor [Paenibacillus eucommiae]MBP1996878.1 hypothetical protein [Paenibacillus eucommiae]
MSEEFKRKLQDYADGKLADADREEVEREIEKMEVYQTYLEEHVAKGSTSIHEQNVVRSDPPIREKRIIRRGKWKARLTNTLTVLLILLAVTIVSSISTGLFYGRGEPNRMEIYRDVVSTTVALTRPNVEVHLNGQMNLFFTMDLSGKLQKKIGDAQSVIGDFAIPFLWAQPGLVTTTLNESSSNGSGHFYNPNIKGLESERHMGSGDWGMLEKLPEGTVAEVFLSFDRLFTTDELLKLFENKNMIPTWFAADTGPEKTPDDSGVVFNPVGFPYFPIWHYDDMNTRSSTEVKRGLLGKTVTSVSASPGIDAYGDGEIRNENFMKSLHLLQEHKSVAKKIAPFLKIDEVITYLEENGVKLYGAVITGPTKELLQLRQEAWVKEMVLGEVRLWNWHDR